MLANAIIHVGLFGLLLTACPVFSEWHDSAGPWVIATKGEPWPLLENRELHSEYYLVEPKSFSFQVKQESCDILEKAVERYRQIILNESKVSDKLSQYANTKDAESTRNNVPTSFAGYLVGLEIHLERACERYPHLSSNESYRLDMPKNKNHQIAMLTAESVWGILRGLETFSQLLTHSDNGLTIKGQTIKDSPRLPHRGLLIDTSRHFLPVADILLTLEAMSYNKLNVLHWHIVDDNSFPYESAVFPELSAKGAYHPSMVYKAEDLEKVIEYARLRGIRVMPEFDTPGHTKSWGLSHPEFLTTCYGTDGKPTGKLGPMNPTYQPLYSFMGTLLNEIANRFPDKYVHLGGDEVPYDCWKSNPEIDQFMQKNNISQKFEKLEELYIQRVLDLTANLKIKPIVWQEVFDNGVIMHEGTVVHVWTGDWRSKMAAVTSAGHPALLSACWYLDHLSSGGDWIKYYNCDPLDFQPISQEQRNLVLGGEACMWGEFVDRNNVHSRIWPRASAAAERLWSAQVQDTDIAAQRLEEHSCRMNRRGIPAQPPNGPGFCVV